MTVIENMSRIRQATKEDAHRIALLGARTLQGAANVGGLSLLLGLASGRGKAMGIVGAAQTFYFDKMDALIEEAEQ